MGTTRDRNFARRPCLCGAGEIVIDHCEINHPWSADWWYEAAFEGCPECERQYVLERGHRIIAIRRDEIDRRKTAWAGAREREVALGKGQDLAAIRASVEEALAGIKDARQARETIEGLGISLSPQEVAAEVKKHGDVQSAAIAQFRNVGKLVVAADKLGRVAEAERIRAERVQIEELQKFGLSKPPIESASIYPTADGAG